MTIALVTDAWYPQVNGVVTTWNHVRDELESMGHSMAVIIPGLFATVPCPKYPEIRLSCFATRRVWAMLDELAPDAIHVPTEGPLGLAARRYCRRQRVAFTTSYHTQFVLYLKRYTGISASLTYRALRWFQGAASATPERRCARLDAARA